MKTNIFSLVLPFFIAGSLLISCGENSKDSKEVQNDSIETNEQMDQKAKDLRAEINQDWENFRASSEEAVANREREIGSLREEILKADKQKRDRLNKELDELEQKNKSLKERIATRTNSVKQDLSDLNEKAIEDHKIAQRELKRDMDELGSAIGNFFKRDND